MEAIRSMHADYHYLPDKSRYNTSADSSNKNKILEEEVTINDCEPSLQTISTILSSEGTDTKCINQKAHLMSEQKQLSPDWFARLEGETVNCEDVTIRMSTSLPILEGCLNVTCVQCENGKSISPINSAQQTIAHDADTDSDLARPPDDKHPSVRQAIPAMPQCYCGVLRAGAPPAMSWRTRVPVTRSEATVERWTGAVRTTRSLRRSGPAEDRAQAGGGPEQEDRGRIRADDVYPECWRSIH
jgi:hypothetical protein